MPKYKSYTQRETEPETEPETASEAPAVVEVTATEPPQVVAVTDGKSCYRTKEPGAAIEFRGARITFHANGLVPPQHVAEFEAAFGAAVVKV